MPTGHIMMAMSLDGFVARKDHTLDWLNKQPTQDEDHGFLEFPGPHGHDHHGVRLVSDGPGFW